jgi:actin-related protein
VIDNGSATIKAGFGGDDEPRFSFPTVVGHPHFTSLKKVISLLIFFLISKQATT